MNIEEFLAEIFIDFYEQEMIASGQVIDSEDFDSLFYKDDDVQLSDIEFVEEYLDEICDDYIIDGVYNYLIDDGCEFDFSIERIVSHFIINYIYDNYCNQELSSIMKFLKVTDLKNVVILFLTNPMFGKSIIKSYLKNYVTKIDYDFVKKKIEDNNDSELLTKWIIISSSYYSLNELLRRNIIDLYDYFISHGCGNIDSINNVWAYFTKDFDPLGKLNDMGVDYDTKQKYKLYTLKIIYSDVYEDVLNGPIIDSVNTEDQTANYFIVNSIKSNNCLIPQDEDIRNRIMKHFLLLHYEKDKRIENRRVTINEGRQAILAKTHPGYILDDFDFIKK